MLLLAAAAHAYDPVEHAVALHLSAAGLERLGEGLAGVVPTELPVGTTTGELVCDEASPDVVLAYELAEMSVGIHVDTVAIVPSAGRLDIGVYGTLDSTPTTLSTSGSCSVLTDLDEVCTIELPSTGFQLHLGLALGLTDGAIDATVDEISLELPPIGNPIDGCTLASAVGTLLGRDENAITTLLLSQIEPSLADLGPTLESAIEDATALLPYQASFSLGEASLDLSLDATELAIDDDGLFVGIGATLASPAASDCVPAAPEPTADDAWPGADGVAGDGALEYDAAVFVDGAFANQLLHAVYSSGVLCLSGGEFGGFELSTGLFGGVMGDAWGELFPESVPLELGVAPVAPPTASFSATGAPFRLELQGLPVRAWADLDGRLAKAFGIRLDGQVGLDLPYADGNISPTLVLDPVALDIAEEGHELLPVGYGDGLAELLPTLLGAFLPEDLLPTVAVPTWQGLGLQQIYWMPDSSGLWLGGYAVLAVDAPEPMELPGCEGGEVACGEGGPEIDLESALGCTSTEEGCGGCSEESGCGESGCSDSGGCTTVPTRPALFLLTLGLAWRRRRG